MPGCLELAPKMTGSTSSGPPHPHKEAAPKAEQHQLRGKMTPRPESGQPGQPMQLTPLWEHVVRTRRFPMSVDAESTFREISDRLRDPEWEVRQHALRVLVDVLPVLEQHVVDKLMVSVVPELVTNLGHPAPAVRKGALDTLRVYLCYSQDKENMFQKILDEGFNRPDALDNFQNNVSMGMILSIPSLLFPSAGSPRPPEGVLKFAVNALASRLVQVTHQEAALRSLARIREIIGGQEFDSHMLDYNANVKRDFEVLCEVYNVDIYQDKEDQSNGETKGEEMREIVPLIKEWSSDSDSSGATDDGRDEEEDRDDVLVGPMPLARVVLETEIKFDEETAITMTILEEKDKDSDAEESDSDNDFDPEDVGVVQVLEDAVTDRRKTRRRVRFGGEIVKLRTPDSDEASIGKPELRRTKIPLPLFPATKMPLDHRRSFSQPTSPTHSNHPKKRSLSSSPKREVYTHNALLSPKKSILTRPSSPVYVIQPVKTRRKDRKDRKKKTSTSSNSIPKNLTQLKQIKETPEADEISAKNSETKENDGVVNGSEESMVLAEVKKETIQFVKSTPDVQKSNVNVDSRERDGDEGSTERPEEIITSKESPKRSSRPSSRVNFDVFPKQERNYILMELSSPERKKYAEKMSGLNESSNDFLPFGAVINDSTNISTPKTEMAVSDQLLTQIIDSVSTATNQTSGGLEGTMIQRFPTTMKTDRSNTTSDVGSKSVQELQGEKFHQDPRISSNISTGLIPRNLQASKETTGQFKGDANMTSTASNKQNSESGVRMDVDKNRSFRELTSDTRNGSTPDESESLTCSSSEGEGYSQEPSWEELGLVDQETLNDLHNKDGRNKI